MTRQAKSEENPNGDGDSVHLVKKKPTKGRTYTVTQAGLSLLRDAQAASQLSYAMLAKGLGCSPPTVHAFMARGQKTFRQLPELCRVLGVPFAATQLEDPLHARAIDIIDRLRSLSPSEAERAIDGLALLVDGLESRARDESVQGHLPRPGKPALHR